MFRIGERIKSPHGPYYGRVKGRYVSNKFDISLGMCEVLYEIEWDDERGYPSTTGRIDKSDRPIDLLFNLHLKQVQNC